MRKEKKPIAGTLLAAVREGRMTQTEAARRAGVSKQVLHNRLYTRPPPQPRPEPPLPPTDYRTPLQHFRAMRTMPDPICDAVTGENVYAPMLLLHLVTRGQTSADSLLDALKGHYVQAVCDGKLAEWRRAATAIIDLVGQDDIAPQCKRADLFAVPTNTVATL